MSNQNPIEEKRVAPRFAGAKFSLDCDDPRDLPQLVNELMRDYQPVRAIEVVLIQRTALKHVETLQNARVKTGVLQHQLNRCIKNDESNGKPAPAGPDAPEWNDLLGRALTCDHYNGKAFSRAVAAAPPTDREFHRCVKQLEEIRERRHGRGSSARKPASPAKMAREAVNVLTAG